MKRLEPPFAVCQQDEFRQEHCGEILNKYTKHQGNNRLKRCITAAIREHPRHKSGNNGSEINNRETYVRLGPPKLYNPFSPLRK